MDIICDELKSNNIEINQETLSFHIDDQKSCEKNDQRI